MLLLKQPDCLEQREEVGLLRNIDTFRSKDIIFGCYFTFHACPQWTTSLPLILWQKQQAYLCFGPFFSEDIDALPSELNLRTQISKLNSGTRTFVP